jgi:hypothetical protein
VGNGNNDVGSKTPPRKTGRPSVDGSKQLPERRCEDRVRSSKESPQVSGAMAEQRCDTVRGDQSAPQKLVRLVGCRDAKERPETALEKSPAKR